MNARASGAAALACLVGLAASALAQPVGTGGALSVTTGVEPAPLVTLAVALALTALAFLAFRARGRGLLPSPEAFGAAPEHRAALYGLVPAILGAHLAVSLFVVSAQGRLFSASVVPDGVWPYLFGLVQTLAGLAFLYGGLTRLFAVLLGACWLVGVAVLGVTPMLENLQVLGFAVFFWLAGRGPLALDRLLFPRMEPSRALMRLAPYVLRASVGLTLMVLSISQNLANPSAVGSFLGAHPLNLLSAAGLAVSDARFAVVIGGLQFMAGLWIFLGLFTREVILFALIPANLIVNLSLGQLVSSLPFVAAMAFLLIWEATPADDDLWLDGLRHGPLAINRPPPLLRSGRNPPQL